MTTLNPHFEGQLALFNEDLSIPPEANGVDEHFVPPVYPEAQ